MSFFWHCLILQYTIYYNMLFDNSFNVKYIKGDSFSLMFYICENNSLPNRFNFSAPKKTGCREKEEIEENWVDEENVSYLCFWDLSLLNHLSLIYVYGVISANVKQTTQSLTHSCTHTYQSTDTLVNTKSAWSYSHFTSSRRVSCMFTFVLSYCSK